MTDEFVYVPIQVSLNLRGTPSLPPNLYLVLCTLLPSPHGWRQVTPLIFAAHLCLTSHNSVYRVPPHRTQCHIPRLPRLGQPFSRALLCRRKAQREATRSKSLSAPDETSLLAHCSNTVGAIVCAIFIVPSVLVLRGRAHQGNR
jgi:hypothetical protein